MRSPGINGEGELRGQPTNPGSPGKMVLKTEFVGKMECISSSVTQSISLSHHSICICYVCKFQVHITVHIKTG